MCAAGVHGRDQASPREVIAAERGIVGGALDRPVDLSAGSVLLVDQQGGEAEFGAEGCRRHAGRAGTDNREVDRHSISIERDPRWRRMRIPGRAMTMQLWRFGTPSISARQSKQTPITH